ncbi:unnamed protein product [Caenorhabditis auriculariae]|uniref:Carbohydrate kinase FGGY N-terminal domain-containing protein n=1 Tax=Caenorhabditis auriculariae TaxID=2777116 RepID=A0A8S1GYH6_9PELO|nr:unnamed protein product [Caenorhabditis auriculariae]
MTPQVENKNKVHLGIDIGTSSVKCCARQGVVILCNFAQSYEKDCGATQDAVHVLQTALAVIHKTCEEVHLPIDDVWICGQMHGVVLWKAESLRDGYARETFISSPLYNWMYDYEDKIFLKTLPRCDSCEVHPGYGMATLVYLAQKDPENLKRFDRCGTIMDLFANVLCHRDDVVMGRQNAQSWAFCQEDSWQSDVVSLLPEHLRLPRIEPKDGVVGEAQVKKLKGATVHVPSGDLQASVASLRFHSKTAYLVLGTSAQLCTAVEENSPDLNRLPPCVVNLPFVDRKRLLAARSMNGGNAIESFLKVKLRSKKIFLPDELEMMDAAHEGIVENIFSMFPLESLQQLGVSRIVLIGSADEPRFARHVRRRVDGFLQVTDEPNVVSAALGATLLTTPHV